MNKIQKNTILNYLPTKFNIENQVNHLRIYDFNNRPEGSGSVCYICEREIRAKNNFALQFALQKSEELGLPLKIVSPKINYSYKPKEDFINRQVEQAKQSFRNSGYDFEIVNNISDFLDRLKISMLIVDFNPILNRNWLSNAQYKIYEIDGHNIVPARYVSQKQEYSASTFRRKIYPQIFPFLTEFKNKLDSKNEADYVLDCFIKEKLQYYKEFKNFPNKDVQSGLSKYLNLGFISSQRVVIEVLKADVDNKNKEAFLEEIIIRKELSDNFCLYCRDFKSFSCAPYWAKESLNEHVLDIRPYIYSFRDLQNCKTHDDIWNFAQNKLIKDGQIHGYLRMYWAKKISEWTKNPEDALKYAIYFNDKYAYDAPSPNGYVGILWSIAALHDRAFSDYQITGKIRRMVYNSIKKKLKR